MSLSLIDIKQQLIQDFNTLLSRNIPFADLQSYLTEKKPIFPTKRNIETLLFQYEANDAARARHHLKLNAYNAQIAQDTREEHNDAQAKDQDQIQLENLLAQRRENENHQSQFRALLASLDLYERAPHQSVHQHNEHNHQHNHNDSHQHGHDDSLVHNAMQRSEIQQKIDKLEEGMREIDYSLIAIGSRDQERTQHRNERHSRAEARADYENRKEDHRLKRTLSAANQARLERDIENALEVTIQQCAKLRTTADQLNYPTFLEQMEVYLGKQQQRTHQEMDALRTILKFMNKHLNLLQEIKELEMQIAHLNSSINDDRNSIERIEEQISDLEKIQNVKLSNENVNLGNENLHLNSSRYLNSEERDTYLTPTLIISTVALLSATPLILALNGFIPLVLESTVLFGFAAVIPALLALTALVLSLITITYAVNAYLDAGAIETNISTIESNMATIKDNVVKIEELTENTRPALELKIQISNRAVYAQQNNTAATQDLAEQTLQRALDVSIYNYASTGFLAGTPKPDAPRAASYNDSDDEDSDNYPGLH